MVANVTEPSKENVDVDHLEVSGDAPDASVSVTNGVIVVINEAFGPTGEQLIGISDVTFDDCPALTVLIRADGREGLVHLSPIHGDRRKSGMTDIPSGTKCELLCPVTKQPLPRVGPVIAGSDAEYYAVYLTPKMDKGSTIYISDVWDHFHSRIVHSGALLSAWAAASDKAAEGA